MATATRSPSPSPELRINAVQCFSGNGNAREVIVFLLKEHGASENDSIFIALNSPKYMEIIVDSV
jgi:hypothetical protein